jgi:hypothetical protein
MPKYLFKWPEEAVWLVVMTAFGTFLEAVFEVYVPLDERVEGPLVILLTLLLRVFGGIGLPTPTPTEAFKSAVEAQDDKPGA